MSLNSKFIWADLFKRRGPIDQPELLDALKNNLLFQNLNPRELRHLSTVVYERVYQMEEPIFSQNERGFGMYLILKGRIAIKLQTSAGEQLITTLESGSFFGELALVDPDNVRSASAVALDQSHLIGFFKPDLMEIIESKPAMAFKILFQLSKILGRRLIETTEKLSLTPQAEIKSIHEDVV